MRRPTQKQRELLFAIARGRYVVEDYKGTLRSVTFRVFDRWRDLSLDEQRKHPVVHEAIVDGLVQRKLLCHQSLSLQYYTYRGSSTRYLRWFVLSQKGVAYLQGYRDGKRA